MKQEKPLIQHTSVPEDESQLLTREALKEITQQRDHLNAQIEKLTRQLSPDDASMISKRRWDCR